MYHPSSRRSSSDMDPAFARGCVIALLVILVLACVGLYTVGPKDTLGIGLVSFVALCVLVPVMGFLLSVLKPLGNGILRFTLWLMRIK
ncbi:hypothetical protein ABZ896_27995 [Streptomyces sp. NPDC047072]|uniref:hypothetical protein n=1 Tax=Streptomyces sp. NPDC047072 TaxID=3154809 RepID=UPI0033DA5E82